MATAEQYAEWIVNNKDKAGTPEFETVASAYKLARGSAPVEDQPSSIPSVKTKSTGEKVLDFAEPTVSALGAVGGGALGLASPILGGTALGAGLGYATANQGMRTLRQLMGYEPTDSLSTALTKNVQDTAVGGSMEAGGAIVARNVIPPLAKGAGWLKDYFRGRSGDVRAASLLKEALKTDGAQATGAMDEAAQGLTPGQALAESNTPTTQALLERSMRNDPARYGSGALTPRQAKAATDTFTDMTGASNRTQAKSVIEGDIARLNQRLIPQRNIELNAANTAGQMKPLLDAESKRMANAAASKVEDVRRFTAAGDRAGARAAATTSVPGMPNTPGRYTYMGELEKKAGQVAQQAADASLPFGEASRFAKAASDSLEAHGLRPLEVPKLLGNISSIAKNPDFAGNDIVEGALKNVASDLVKWQKSGGVIDAFAIDAIRQNSVNAAVQQLRPTLDQTAQKRLAAGVLTKIKPMLIDAVEQSGGTGYRQYLQEYATGRQVINQRKLIGQAQDLFKNNPKEFVALIKGDNPDLIEKTFGAGSYNVIKEMSADSMSQLTKIANTTERGLAFKSQAADGQQALRNLLEKHDPRLVKIPWGLSPKTMALNKGLDVAERRMGRQTLDALTKAADSPEAFMRALNQKPSKETAGLLRFLLESPPIPGLTVSAGETAGIFGRQ